MEFDAATMERTAKTFRSDVWEGACEDAVLECGIAKEQFGPVQVTVFKELAEAPGMNLILGAAEEGAVEKGHLANAIGWADEFDVAYRVAIARGRPGTAAAESFLNHQGFEQGRGHWKFVRDTSPPDMPGNPAITVWQIDDEDAAGETMAFSAGPAAGMPPLASTMLCALPTREHWHAYTAELEDDIVSFGSLLIDGSIAHIALDGTVPEARRRGCQTVLLRKRILAAWEAGCETIFAELPEGESDGLETAGRNLLRAGFLPAYRSMNWQRPR